MWCPPGLSLIRALGRLASCGSLLAGSVAGGATPARTHNALRRALVRGDLRQAEVLLKSGAPTNIDLATDTPSGRRLACPERRSWVRAQPAVVWAASAGRVETARLLLRHGADPETRVRGLCCTVLHLASMLCDPRETELLLRYGADPNALDRHGRTPLIAALRNHALCEEHLRNRGSRQQGSREFLRQSMHPIGKVVQVLVVRYGADRSWSGDDGHDAAHWSFLGCAAAIWAWVRFLR